MKKAIFFFLALAATGFSENLVLDNQTIHPTPKSKIAIQWALSAKEVDEGNRAAIHGFKLNPNSLQILSQAGKIILNIPQKAEYFRIVAWSKGQGEPDLLTNWVEIIPNKTYTLKADHLTPAVLLQGSGC